MPVGCRYFRRGTRRLRENSEVLPVLLVAVAVTVRGVVDDAKVTLNVPVEPAVVAPRLVRPSPYDDRNVGSVVVLSET